MYRCSPARHRLSSWHSQRRGVERLRALTYERQRLGRAAPNGAAALQDVIGVYSAHPSAPL
jgi:hypothetical protein